MAEVESSSSITVTVTPPEVINGITYFEVTVSSNGTTNSNCTALLTSSNSSCVIGGLKSGTNYTISAYSCVEWGLETIRGGEISINYLLDGIF